MARSGSWRANPQRSWCHFDQAFNNVAPDDLCRSLRFRHRDRRNGASRGLKHSAAGGVVAPPHAFGAIRIEPGNLRLRRTAWWGWEDSNFQPNGYCRETGEPGRSHSASFDHRRRPETLRTAMAMAFFCPTNTTSRFPLVTPV